MRIKNRLAQRVALAASVATAAAFVAGFPVSARADTSTLTPTAITTSSGSTGGQSVANLAVRDQSGSADRWDSYVEFRGPYSGYLTFTLPGDVSPSSVTGIMAQVNYRGPATSTQTWTFSLFAWPSGSWVPVGTNAGAPDWGDWQLLTLHATGTVANYMSPTGAIRLRISASNDEDAADIDFAAIGLTTATSSPPVDRGLPAPIACPNCWHPPLRTSWNWVISEVPHAPYRAVQLYDIDGFEATAADVGALHRAGKKVVCYISVGSYENWRPDAGQFPTSLLGRHLDGWAGERWLDVRDIQRPGSTLARIMKARVDMCTTKGFDGVEFDNMEGYANPTGLPLTARDQALYNVFLANAAHARGLTTFMKNDLDQIPQLLPYFDAALNESCHEFDECDLLGQFVRAGKPVFNAEYEPPSGFCADDNAANINGVRFALDLDDSVFEPCR